MSFAKELNTEEWTDRQFENFTRRVNKDGPIPDQSNPHYKDLGPCWSWEGAILIPSGYGKFAITHRTFIAHRASWSLRNGTVPAGAVILHKCDNRTCVNPDHLTIGTQLENRGDCANKRRTAWGSKNGQSKLTEDQVRSLRIEAASGASRKSLVKKYGVSKTIIAYAITRKSWYWLD